MNEKLKIGKIPYLNLFPLYNIIESKYDCSDYLFIEGVPSELNKMLRDGEIDISPSSSIEYIRNTHLYELIDGHSISCSGCIASILLFSKKPIDKLEGCKIFVTSQSETSIALLNIVLKKFYSIQANLIVIEKPENAGGEAFFLIGDDALKSGKKLAAEKTLSIYDLGEIWSEHTGLPFVFALWIARKEVFQDQIKKTLLDRFISDLDGAKKTFRDNIDIMSRSASFEYLRQEEIVSYWNKISYDLKDTHKKALELFKKYLQEI